MADEDDERLARPDGHRYEAPESDETRISKEWSYAVLGILVADDAGPDRDRDGADLPG